MTDPASIAEPTPPTDPAENHDADLQQTLRTLLDAGAKLVQDLVADPGTSPAAKAQPFDLYARAIRRTVVLVRHLAENPTKRAPSTATSRTQSRRKIIRDVEDAIVNRIERPDEVDSLCSELHERLDDPEFDHDLATRPLADIIRDLKRDLGLDTSRPPAPRRTPMEIRELNARAAATPKPPPDPDLDDPDFEYEPGTTRSNALLARYREAADG